MQFFERTKWRKRKNVSRAKAYYKDANLVFAHADGTRVNPWGFGRAALDCIKRAKVTQITLHGLRDTHADLCAQAGVAMKWLAASGTRGPRVASRCPQAASAARSGAETGLLARPRARDHAL